MPLHPFFSSRFHLVAFIRHACAFLTFTLNDELANYITPNGRGSAPKQLVQPDPTFRMHVTPPQSSSSSSPSSSLPSKSSISSSSSSSKSSAPASSHKKLSSSSSAGGGFIMKSF